MPDLNNNCNLVPTVPCGCMARASINDADVVRDHLLKNNPLGDAVIPAKVARWFISGRRQHGWKVYLYVSAQSSLPHPTEQQVTDDTGRTTFREQCHDGSTMFRVASELGIGVGVLQGALGTKSLPYEEMPMIKLLNEEEHNALSDAEKTHCFQKNDEQYVYLDRSSKCYSPVAIYLTTCQFCRQI